MARTCSADEKKYDYNVCFPQACKNGACVPASCPEPGKRSCQTSGSYEMCLPSMLQLTTLECEAGTTCAGGACVEIPCDKGDQACGFGAALTCNDDGQGWTPAECGADKYCDEDSGDCVSKDPFCAANVLGSRCLSKTTAVHCDELGQASTEECSGVCFEGFCQPVVCDVSYPDPGADATGQDAEVVSDAGPDVVDVNLGDNVTIDLGKPDIPPLEKPAKAWVTITGGAFGGEKITFTASKNANYVFKDKDLQVAMAKGVYLLEVHFGGIEENVVGSFSSDEPGSVNVWIWFNDGTTDQTQIQWKYQSSKFQVTLDQFEPPGGRVVGTFAGQLEDATGGPALELTDGYFDVPRKE